MTAAFSWQSVFLALTLGSVTLLADRPLPSCKDSLAFPETFWSGRSTDAGQIPADYFKDPRDGKGRPRFVLLIGAPGAGKSTWARAAKAAGWTFVACDDVRVALLAEWRELGRKVTDGEGRLVLADPGDGSQFWDPDVLAEMIRRTQKKMHDALAAREPIAIEAAGPHLMPIRAARMSTANRAGYGVEALVFTADEPAGHVANTQARVANGGTAPSAALVARRFVELRFFGSPFRVDASHATKNEVPEVTEDFDWMELLPERYGTLEEALAKMAGKERTRLERYRAEDVFHRVDFVWVPAFR